MLQRFLVHPRPPVIAFLSEDSRCLDTIHSTDGNFDLYEYSNGKNQENCEQLSYNRIALKKTSKQEMSLAEMTFYCFRDCADWVVCPLERGGG